MIVHIYTESLIITLPQYFSYTGKRASVDEGLIDRRVMKTSPSGGCRHPIEVYPIVNKVEGVTRGIYHYSVRKHGLSLIKPGNFEEEIVHYCSGQTWFRNVAVLFVMTAILARSMWRYRNSRAYRVLQIDAGHLGQTFCLVCTSLKLGPLTTAALQDSFLETDLDIDGLTEVVIYAAAVGVPEN
jgi:SagB-type dehydrogenase family enzyme